MLRASRSVSCQLYPIRTRTLKSLLSSIGLHKTGRVQSTSICRHHFRSIPQHACSMAPLCHGPCWLRMTVEVAVPCCMRMVAMFCPHPRLQAAGSRQHLLRGPSLHAVYAPDEESGGGGEALQRAEVRHCGGGAERCRCEAGMKRLQFTVAIRGIIPLVAI